MQMRKHSLSEKELEVIAQTLNTETLEGPQYFFLVQPCLQVVMGRGYGAWDTVNFSTFVLYF